MTDHALRKLRANPRLAELAAFPFDFDVDRAAHGHVEPVRLASGGPLTVVAGDDTGGTYVVCGDGAVLHADSEGGACLIGTSVDEALEVLIGLADWGAFADLTPEDGEERILARTAEVEEEIREHYGIDAEREELLAGLGLARRSPVELVGMLHRALTRTEPDHVLLNARELNAYRFLHDPDEVPPPWEYLGVATDGYADPAAQPLATWTRPVLAQGRTEAVRVALIRRLDAFVVNQGLLRRPDTPGRLDPSPLRELAEEFEHLGDFPQALRAQRLYAALQDTPGERAAAAATASRLEEAARRAPRVPVVS
ncbi:hypothetical protein ACFW6K_13990 [Streptomyces sp. NPDC058733]|uniref:hypothetical protein n=1 Tax=unclassified Streptomyces TaxID=2593676 RepID=UPI0036523065